MTTNQHSTKSKALAKDVFVYAIGTFATRILGFVLLPFYTAVLSKEEFGYVDLLLTGSMLFTTVISLRLFDGVYRFLWEAESEEKKSVIVSSVLNVVLLNALLAAVLLYGVLYVFGLPFPHAGLVIAWTLIRLPAEYFQQTARVVGNKAVYSMSGIVMAVTLIVVNLLLLGYYKLGVAGYLWSLIAANATTLVYCVTAHSGARLYRFNRLSFATLKPLLAYTLPLIPAAVSWWVIRGSGRYVLGSEHGLNDVGIYAVSDKLPTVVYMLNMTFYMAWQDAVMKHHDDPNQASFLSQVLNTYIRVGLSALTILSMLLKPFFALMVAEPYHDALVYVPALLLAVFVLCMAGLYDAFYLAAKQTRRLLITSIAGALVAIILNILLVPKYSLWATVVSTFASAAVLLALRMGDVHRTQPLSINYLHAAGLLALFTVASCANALQGNAYIAAVILVAGAVAAINRLEIKNAALRLRTRLT